MGNYTFKNVYSVLSVIILYISGIKYHALEATLIGRNSPKIWWWWGNGLRGDS